MDLFPTTLPMKSARDKDAKKCLAFYKLIYPIYLNLYGMTTI